MNTKTHKLIAKVALAALVAGMCVLQLAYADTKISNLPAAGAITGTEPVPAVQGGATVKTTPAAIDTYVKGSSVVTAVVAGGTNLAAAAEDNVMVGNATTWQSKALTSCSAATSAVTYNTTTNAFGCNTISGGTAVLSVAKAVTTSRTSTATLADDPELVFTNLAAGTYSVEFFWVGLSASSTPEIAIGMRISNAPTATSNWMCNGININTDGLEAHGAAILTSPGQTAWNLTAGNNEVVQCKGTLVNSATSTLAFQWSQSVSDGTATQLLRGSWINLIKIL